MSDCPPGPEGQTCALSIEGHAHLRRIYSDDPRIASWGPVHTADVERTDLFWRDELVVRAGMPIPLPYFWGDGPSNG